MKVDSQESSSRYGDGDGDGEDEGTKNITNTNILRIIRVVRQHRDGTLKPAQGEDPFLRNIVLPLEPAEHKLLVKLLQLAVSSSSSSSSTDDTTTIGE